MAWGIYNVLSRKNLVDSYIKPEDIQGAGYLCYKMGDVTLEDDYAYLFLAWSWSIQVDLDNVFDAKNSHRQFEVWTDLKFEGSAFPPWQS